MANNKSMIDQILETQRELNKQDCFAGTVKVGSSTLYPPQFPSLPKPAPEELLPDQKEMDKLASALTEAVLQLRAGDMKGARKTLSDADGLCDVRISAHTTQVPDHYLDAVRYGSSTRYEPQHIYQPPDSGASAREQLLRQQLAEQQMRQLMENVNTTLYPPHILSDNTADPTDSGV